MSYKTSDSAFEKLCEIRGGQDKENDMTNHGIPTPLLFAAIDVIEHRMPCHISDGPEFEDEPLTLERDPDDFDSLNDTLIEIARLQIPTKDNDNEN